MVFNCDFWGVVRVDIAHQADGSIIEEDTTADVAGVWDTEAGARAWTAQQHSKTEKPSWWKPGESYETETYIVVSCRHFQLRWLSELDSALEMAAKLAVFGVSTGASK